ncbi:hypothetical protein POL68_11990 [Stigmatella sp. ncwal1]|uniref:Uncharacterized protein n=1 Tax=Stigmatella ashevillensis TaxID=2995309 RepID=A0ABT5D692_9BACT|nr:hypothetical protein [Stigmatella ashevillena]MDC0709185.1 hypothetical protein [Stigmatella ashevillena]
MPSQSHRAEVDPCEAPEWKLSDARAAPGWSAIGRATGAELELSTACAAPGPSWSAIRRAPQGPSCGIRSPCPV